MLINFGHSLESPHIRALGLDKKRRQNEIRKQNFFRNKNKGDKMKLKKSVQQILDDLDGFIKAQTCLSSNKFKVYEKCKKFLAQQDDFENYEYYIKHITDKLKI